MLPPFTSSLNTGEEFDMPILPEDEMLIRTALFVRILNALLSVVPIKCVAGLVPALPERFQLCAKQKSVEAKMQ